MLWLLRHWTVGAIGATETAAAVVATLVTNNKYYQILFTI